MVQYVYDNMPRSYEHELRGEEDAEWHLQSNFHILK